MKLVRVDSETEMAALVRRVIDREPGAEDELVLRYSDGIKIIIDKIVRNSIATEDLSQETFRTLFEKLRRGDLRQPERVSGFVCSVARNAAVDHVRRTQRSARIEAVINVEHIPDPAPSPFDELLKRERAMAVHQVIAELKIDRDRQLLLRYFIAEHDKNKICQDLHITRLQFNYVIYRAVARFKELLKSKLGDI